MKDARSLVGFVDLTLILLGSVALFGEMQQRDGPAEQAIKPEHAPDRTDTVNVPIGRLFEPDEARLSAQGGSWVTQLSGRAQGKHVAIRVALDEGHGSARLDAWELAAARTASIMHVMKAAGYPPDKIEPSMPRDRNGPSGVTFSLDD